MSIEKVEALQPSTVERITDVNGYIEEELEPKIHHKTILAVTVSILIEAFLQRYSSDFAVSRSAF